MKIGITGVTGHVGSNLYPILIEQGYEVRCLLRNKIDRPYPEEYFGDITDELDVDEFVKGLDAVIHLAAKISISGDSDGRVRTVNYIGTRNIAQSCLKHNIKRLVHFSTIHTFDPYPQDQELTESRNLLIKGSAYDKSKIEAETAIMKYVAEGLNAVILSPTSIFGPNDFRPSLLGQALLDIYRNKIPSLVPGGYDFVDVRDVALAAVNALHNGQAGEKFILSGKWLSIKELAFKIGEIAGVQTPQKVLPSKLLKMLLPFIWLYSVFTKKPPLFTKETLNTLTESNKMISSAKAKSELNYSAREIDQTIQDTLEWFRNNS